MAQSHYFAFSLFKNFVIRVRAEELLMWKLNDTSASRKRNKSRDSSAAFLVYGCAFVCLWMMSEWKPIINARNWFCDECVVCSSHATTSWQSKIESTSKREKKKTKNFFYLFYVSISHIRSSLSNACESSVILHKCQICIGNKSNM